MTGQHPSLPYPTPTPATSSGMPPENLPGLCPLPYDGRLLGPAAAYPRLADLYPGYPEHVAYTHHPAMHLYPTALVSLVFCECVFGISGFCVLFGCLKQFSFYKIYMLNFKIC